MSFRRQGDEHSGSAVPSPEGLATARRRCFVETRGMTGGQEQRRASKICIGDPRSASEIRGLCIGDPRSTLESQDLHRRSKICGNARRPSLTCRHRAMYIELVPPTAPLYI